MATKKSEPKQEALFTKEQILASDKYSNKKDICNTLIPDDFQGTLNEVNVLIEKFMKGKVK